MTRKNLLVGCCLLIIFLSGCSQSGTTQSNATQTGANGVADGSPPIETSTKTPPEDVVRVDVPGVELKAGGTAEASVKLTIAGGFHINANPPSFPYLKATELTVGPDAGLTPGKPAYPSSVTRKFAFSPDPLAVYEGETAIKLPLSAAADAKKGAQTLKGKLRVQPCDEEACYLPRTVDVSIPVTVK